MIEIEKLNKVKLKLLNFDNFIFLKFFLLFLFKRLEIKELNKIK